MTPPVRPRHAASLLLLRRSSKGPEVLMGRRPKKSSFAPDVFVFPGGKVDPADYRRHAPPLAEGCIEKMAASPGLAHALAAAALRETWEETGLDVSAAPLRLAARAITPTMSPIRFHARFFVTDAEHAVGVPAATPELSDLAFRPIDEALKLPIIDVTEAVLHALAEEAPPFLFTYRRGRPRITALAEHPEGRVFNPALTSVI